MSNKIKGVFDIVTPEETYKVKFGMNAICDIEDRFNKPIHEVFTQDLGANVRMKDLRLCVWAGLQEYHPELTEKDAGNVIDQVGMEAAMGVLMEAVLASFPNAEKAAAGSKKKGKSTGGDDGKNATPQTGESGQLTS